MSLQSPVCGPRSAVVLLLTDAEVRVLLGAVLWTSSTNPNLTSLGRNVLSTLDRKLMAEITDHHTLTPTLPSTPTLAHSLSQPSTSTSKREETAAVAA
jgi:hypothetical protein